jgi:hypothetical protein
MTRCHSGDVDTTASFRKRGWLTITNVILDRNGKDEPIPIAKSAPGKARKATQTHTDIVMPEWRAKILAIGMITHANIALYIATQNACRSPRWCTILGQQIIKKNAVKAR